MAMPSNTNTVPFSTFIQMYSARAPVFTGTQGSQKNYLHLCKNKGAWQKHLVPDNKFLLFLPLFTVFTPPCYLLTTIFSTSTEQKTQRASALFVGSPRGKAGG